MILYVVNNRILWWHNDVSIKEQEQFKEDVNCIVVSKEVTIPAIPQDGYNYILQYDSKSMKVTLVQGCKMEVSHEDLTKEIHQSSVQLQDDTLLGIELNTDTNSKVTTTGADSLLLMELMMSIDEKLTLLLQPKA